MEPDKNYNHWITSLKGKIRSVQIKAALAVNEELITLYWEIGKMIVQKQTQSSWGAKLIDQVAKDLKRDLPDTKGFSRSNLYSMRQFYMFYSGNKTSEQLSSLFTEKKIVHQVGGLIPKGTLLVEIPWRHHVLIINKCASFDEALFYIKKTIVNNWSRNVLQVQIESNLYARQGKAINNFEQTLPKPQSDLAQATLKDPYKFDFLTLSEDIRELDLEKHLIDNITQFLLELGKGFAYVGRQYPLMIGNKERKIDLLFYHTRMHCYVVIDLKTGEFEPEYAGKMNYYLSAVDDFLKTEKDGPTIGIILCKAKDSLDVDYAIRDINKPLSISEYAFSELPAGIRKNLPSARELEKEMKRMV